MSEFEELMDEDEQLEIRFMLYCTFGTAVIICNIICITVFISSREYQKKFALYLFVSTAELINGISFLTTGVGREILLKKGSLHQSITSFQCMIQYPWPTILLIAGTLPAAANFSITLERLLAVRFMASYRGFSNTKSVMIISSISFSLSMLLLAFIVSYFHSIESPHQMCAVMNAVGPIFGTVHFFVIANLYFIGLFIVLYVFNFANKYKKLSASELRMQRTSIALIVVCSTFVGIPNYILILDNWKIPKFSELVVGVAYCLYATQSCTTLLIVLRFRPEFRRRALEIFCPCKAVRDRVTSSCGHTTMYPLKGITQSDPITNKNDGRLVATAPTLRGMVSVG